MTNHPTPTPQAAQNRAVGTATVIRANARCLPLPDNSVDLCVTSPPYFALRSYQDDGEHYAGQIGDEPTPTEFIDALIEVTAECVRVLKPTGSLWINLGDKYSGAGRGNHDSDQLNNTAEFREARLGGLSRRQHAGKGIIPAKSLMMIPARYAIRCIDDLGLILRAEVILDKKNGLPESVTDRVRRSHEQVFHFVKEPRYFSAVDEIRVAHTAKPQRRFSEWGAREVPGQSAQTRPTQLRDVPGNDGHPLGALPGSVWPYTSEPFQPPAHLGVEHYAAYATALPRQIILGWSPSGVCTGCGEGRRPVAVRASMERHNGGKSPIREYPAHHAGHESRTLSIRPDYRIDGYTCACDPRVCRTCFWIGRDDLSCDLEDSPCCDGCTHGTPAPTAPAVVLDPFGGTGTTALVAKALGRHGISIDMSADYGRLARWRTNDLDQLAKVQGIRRSDQARAADGLDMDTLFDFDGGAA